MPDETGNESDVVEDIDSPITVPLMSWKVLDQLWVTSTRLFPEKVVVETEWVVEQEMKMLRARMSSVVLAEKLAKDSYTRSRVFPFPASPWQFFKERHRTSWWLSRFARRWPVVYEKHEMKVTVGVDRYLAYPQATIIASEFGRPVQYEAVRLDVQEPRHDRG